MSKTNDESLEFLGDKDNLSKNLIHPHAMKMADKKISVEEIEVSIVSEEQFTPKVKK